MTYWKLKIEFSFDNTTSHVSEIIYMIMYLISWLKVAIRRENDLREILLKNLDFQVTHLKFEVIQSIISLVYTAL